MNGQKASAEIKVGYLIKFAKISKISQRKRYFVLNGNTLTYYATHRDVSSPKGNILLVGGSVLTDENIDGVGYAFKLQTPFESLVMAAAYPEDRAAWKFAITNAIEFAQYSLRGYMIKKGGFLEGSPRKFFVLHNNILSFHADHEHTAVSQGAIEIVENTEIIAKDEKLQITVTEGFEKYKMVFDKKNANDYIKWKEALFENLARFNIKKEQEMAEVDEVLDKASMNGALLVRPHEGGDVWPEMQVALTENSLVIIETLDNGEHFKIFDSYIIHKDCKVIATHLKPNAFQVVTAERILHMAAETEKIAEFWMSSILGTVKVAVTGDPCFFREGDPNESLYRAALTKISLDTYYDAEFTEAKPLGIVLERVGEWALVKVANFKDTGVKVGSALCAINGESVLFEKYEETVGRFKNWKPPLVLSFRQAPEKTGFLLKKSNKKSSAKTWGKRYFVLGEGKLLFRNSDSSFARNVMELPLFGATVHMIPKETYGKFYTFRVLSGVHSFTMEAADINELREWTAMIYHAIAFANGGSYIVQYELAKHTQALEMKRTLEIQKAANEYNVLCTEVIERVAQAVEARVLDNLEVALKEAEDNEITGEYIDFANKTLEELRQEAEQAKKDEELFAAAAAFEAEQQRLAAEAALLDAQLGPDKGAEHDDEDDVDDSRQNSMKAGTAAAGRNVSIAFRKKRNTLTAAAASGMKRGMIQAMASTVEEDEDEDDDDEEEENEEAEESTSSSAIKRKKRAGETAEAVAINFSNPANIEDLRKMFRYYVKKSNEKGEGYINVMEFSTIWRIVTKEKGNLYKEMQIFNKFDVERNGYMVEQDFIAGWLNLATEHQNDEQLRCIKFLLGEDNVLL